MTAITQAISSIGKIADLAAAIGVSPQAVRKWEKEDKVPAERVLLIESITGVPRYELRPDIYPPEEYKQAS